MKNWLSLNDVAIAYGHKVVVEHCSFSVLKGEILSLLGPSGCGKSTLLKAISGLLPINSGEIILDNKIIANKNVNLAPQDRQMGMIFQDYALFPHLTVKENIAFGLHSIEKNEQERLINEALKLVRLEEFVSRYPHQISGGQQQRVALARALVRRPRLLLLDEPFSNLDNQVRKQVIEEMKEIFRQQKMTAIFVTHNKTEAFALADAVAVMKDGRIEQIGTPKKLYDKPSNQELATFLGEGASIIAEVCQQGLKTALGIIPFEKLNVVAVYNARGNYKTIFLRPHQLYLGLKEGVNVTIKSSLFLGDFLMYKVDTGHEEIKVMSQKRFEVGETVKLMLRL